MTIASSTGTPSALENDLFLRACRREPVSRTPVWMMRQAGRYLPEYQGVRARASFLQMCKTPELACEVTLQPLERFGFDAAILFSDILIPLEPMGLGLEFVEGLGPQIPNPARDRAAVEALEVPDPETSMAFVPGTIREIRRALAGRVPLIGFGGAPFTMATYAVEGGGSKTYPHTKGLLFGDPDAAHALMAKLAETTSRYLEAQIRAGAQAVQIFDSWAGILAPRDFREFALAYARRAIEQIKGSAAYRDNPAPIIYFVNGCAPYLEDIASSGADVIGIDWRIDLDEARRRLGPDVAVQGNLDPTCLFMPPEPLVERVREVLAKAGDAPGHIFNLGHGVLPNTDPDRVGAMVEEVRAASAR